MKAMQFRAYGGPEQLVLNDLPDPIPETGEILVAVAATSVNPIDWKLHAGMLRWIKPTRFPSTPCFDFAGTVAAIGAGVTAHAVGDRVFGMLPLGPAGAAAEYLTVAADLVAQLPASIDFHQAAGLPLAGMTALQAIRDDGRLQADQELLVVGAAGGVGHYAVQLGKALQARVTGICSGGNVEMVGGLGADEVIDYTRSDFQLPAKRFHVILDAVTRQPVRYWRPALHEDGVYVSLLPTFEMGWQWLKLRLFARQRVCFTVVKSRVADLGFLSDLADGGRLRTIIDQTLPLTNLGAALERSRSGRTRGKLIVAIQHANGQG